MAMEDERERPVEPTTNMMEESEMEESSLLDLFTEKEWMEIEFNRLYVEEYGHGTSGHLIRTIVAKLADLLEKYYPDEDLEGEG